MPARELSWWYAPERRLARLLLAPVAAAYGAVSARRMQRAPSYRSALPVICVGNFTAGGTGKTPLVRLIAERLAADGAAPAILSRGYGGRLAGPHWVDPTRDRAGDVGDEPLQHAAHCPTLIARDRTAGARAIEADLRAFTHILMDDGLQNPALAKSLRIAVVDGRRGVGNGAVIPAGPLRAPLGMQMRSADAIVVNWGFADRPGPRPADLAAFEGPVFDAAIAPVGVTDWMAGGPLVAFAGIGAPGQFFAMLERLGGVLAERVAFADHHEMSDAEARNLLALAAKAGARLVTTEKDLARLAGREGAAGDVRSASRAVPIAMHIEDLRFDRLIADAAAR